MSILGGVPVLRRSTGKFSLLIDLAISLDGSSTSSFGSVAFLYLIILPAGLLSFPICILPPRNVPVVRITASDSIFSLF